MTLEKQKAYCKKKGLPLFAPEKCFSCGRVIPDSGNNHITGCPYCNHSFCE